MEEKASLDDYVHTEDGLLGTSASKMRDHRPKEKARQPIEHLLPSSGSVINPNAEDILRRVSVVVVNHITTAERKLKKRVAQAELFALPPPKRNVVAEEFSERHFVRAQWRYDFCDVPKLSPFTCYALRRCRPRHSVPGVKTVHSFIRRLFVNARLSAECSVVCLVYVERLMDLSGLRLYPHNWRPVMLCGLLLASKIWQDMAAWNIEFSNIYPQFSLKNINRLERMFVQRLDWKLVVTGAEYAKHYFALRSMNARKDFRRKYISTLTARQRAAAGGGAGPAGPGRVGPGRGGGGPGGRGGGQAPHAQRFHELSKQAAQVFSRSMPR
jgi:hypothetical protein